MSLLYFFRHGQAGTRDNYDTLSDIGRKQARLLGEFLVSQPYRFSSVLCGGMKRQRETMKGVAEACQRAGVELPKPVIDPGWNEFDLFGIYARIAPRLCADDPAFRAEFERQQRLAESVGANIHHQWSSCDEAVVDAWIESRYPIGAETWPEFLTRVRGNRARLPETPDGEAIAIFSSAAPISVWVADAAGAPDSKIIRLTGAMLNTAMSVLRVENGETDVVSFNATPHLADPALRTRR